MKRQPDKTGVEDDATQTLAGLGPRSESRSSSRTRERATTSASGVRRPPTPAEHDGPETIGRFSILDQIGSGGMGELFLGWDGQLDRKLAIKLVRTRHRSELTEQRLRREAKILAQLSHPNVVPVFDVGEHEGRVFIAMEFVEGRTLRTWIADLELGGAARVETIISCFVAAGRGLAAVHAAGLAHRDFKPENVIVGGDGRVRIVDFGLARALDEGEDSLFQADTGATGDVDSVASNGARDEGDSLRETAALTETGALLGTPRYMAPEQWQGRRGDARSDQFGFCVALYEALYEVRPFDAPNLEALADAVKRGLVDVPPRRPDIPNRVRDAILRGLSPAPEQRFESMTQLLEQLAPSPPSKRPLVRGALVAGALLIAALAWLGWGRRGPELDDGDESTFALLRRELTARAHLERVESQIATLSEAGRHAEADAAFAAFAALPDHAGTVALGRGWLAQARRLEARAELEAELDAYASAYLSSAASVQREALLGLARVFARTRQWQRLAGTLEALEARADPRDATRAEELRAMRVAALASQRDLVGAAQVLEPLGPESGTAEPAPLLPAIRQLSRASITEHVLVGGNLQTFAVPGLDLDGDEVGELLVVREGERAISLLGTADPHLPVLAQIELDGHPGERPEDLSVLRGTSEPLLGVREGSWLSLHRLGPSSKPDPQRIAVERLFEVEQAGQQSPSWAFGDLDDDGLSEVYLGNKAERRLHAIERDATGSWRHGDPHLSTTAASSVIHEVVAGDVDGDGTGELVVLAGEWSAYDLRILRAGERSGDPPQLELLARRKLGAVHSLALIPAGRGPGLWIAVGVADLYASRRVFPADAPGGPPGLYVFAWDGEQLEQVAYLDVPWPARLFAGDFDGNGLADLALATRRLPQYETAVVLQTRPASFEPLTMTQLWPVGVVDRDRDGDDELLVIDADVNRDIELARGRLFVLGSGDERLPPLTDERSEVGPPPTTSAAVHVDESLAGSIARAEDLAHIGLPLRAADTLRELARVAPPQLAASLSLRAAELFDVRGHRLAAAELYARAAADPQLLRERAGPARVRAMQLYAEVHRFAEAAYMAEAALEFAEPHDRAELEAELARLAALSADGSKLVFDFESPLDPRWAIDPLAVRRRHGRLELELGGPEQGVVARRELYWDGGRLALEVELDVTVVEWGSEVNVALVPLERASDDPAGAGEALEVGVTAWGGGGIYELKLRCASAGIPEPGARGVPLTHPHAELGEGEHRFVLAAELVPDVGRRWCRADGAALHLEAPLDGNLAPGRYELQIRGSGLRWARAAASIARITVTGVRDPDDLRRPVTRFESLGRELAEGRAESLLDALARDDSELDPRKLALLRFLALDELGRWEPGEQALAQALGLPRNRPANDCRRSHETRELVGLLLRHRPERLGPTLRRLCRTDDYFSILYEVWGTAAFQHPESDAIERLLTTQTAELERWQPRSSADRLAALILLRQRAQAWSAQGADGAARAELERAVELGERWAAELDEHDHFARAQFETQLGQCRTALAVELLDRGDEGRALEVLRVALERSPTPEILADVLFIDDRFVRLRDRPLWRELVDPARAGLRARERDQ